MATRATVAIRAFPTQLWSDRATHELGCNEVECQQDPARGTGLAAAGTRVGGVFILAAVVTAVAAPSITATVHLGAVPLVVALGLTTVFGVETGRKGSRRSRPRSCRRRAPVA